MLKKKKKKENAFSIFLFIIWFPSKSHDFQGLQKTREKTQWKPIVVNLHSSSRAKRNTPCFIHVIMFPVMWLVLHEGIQKKCSLISSRLRARFTRALGSLWSGGLGLVLLLPTLSVWPWLSQGTCSPCALQSKKMIQALRQRLCSLGEVFTYCLYSPCTKHWNFWFRAFF